MPEPTFTRREATAVQAFIDHQINEASTELERHQEAARRLEIELNALIRLRDKCRDSQPEAQDSAA